jgi:hypothetical protein
MPRVDDSPVDLSEGAACFGGVQLEAQFKLGSPGDPPHRPPCPDMGSRRWPHLPAGTFSVSGYLCMNRRNWGEKTEFAELRWLSGGHGSGVGRSHGPIATASLMSIVQILVALYIRGRVVRPRG